MTAPHDPTDDLAGRTPVTVMLTPEQLRRFETVAACLCINTAEIDIDDNDVADALFDTGLAAFENLLKLEPLA